MQAECSNLLLYSGYDSTYWTASISPASVSDSFGTRCDFTRVSVSLDNTTSVINGVTTWESTGRFESAAVDVSSLTDVCFSVVVGPHQESTSPELIITAGYTDASSSDTTLVTRTTKSSERVWWSRPIGDIVDNTSALQFWFNVASTGKYWWDDAQVEDAENPGEFIKTTSASVVYDTDTPLMTVRKVCPRCRERLLRTSAIYTNHTASVDAPVPMEHQEP